MNIAHNIEQILEESVELFSKIGLVDLAQKWDLILTNYRSSISHSSISQSVNFN